MDKLWTKSFVLLTVTMFFLYTGFYSLLPVLPIHLNNIGAKQWQIGIIVGLFTLSAVICRPFVGDWLDRYGRKVYIYIGIIFFAIFTFAYSIIPLLSLVIVVRMLHGMSWGVANTALGTAITDNIPTTQLGQGMGWYGLSMTMAMAIGPLLGNYIMGQYSAALVFIFAAFITIIPLVFINKLKFIKKQKKSMLVPIIWSRTLIFNLVVVGCLSFSFGGVTTYVPLYIGDQLEDVSIFFMVYAISLSICRPLTGKWIDYKGEKLVVIVSLGLVIVALLQLSVINNMFGIIVSAAIYGLGFGMAQPALQTSILRLVSLKRAGSANAIFFTAFDIGIGSGAIILGLCSGVWSYSILFIISSVVGMIGLFIYVAMIYLTPKICPVR